MRDFAAEKKRRKKTPEQSEAREVERERKRIERLKEAERVAFFGSRERAVRAAELDGTRRLETGFASAKAGDFREVPGNDNHWRPHRPGRR